MDDAAGFTIAGALAIGALAFGGRVLVQVVRNHLARVHAIRSIPLPRHTTLMSFQPKGQVEAVFLDAFDTEYRRHFDGEPRYEKHSAQEIAELRVFLLGRAFQRTELRILYETEIGVPLLRKLEDRDAEVCAWAQDRLKVHRPPFRKPYTIEDLILKPSRFRWFLWTCGIGASQVLFFERIFQALPITIVIRRLPAASSAAEAAPVATSLPPASNGQPPDRQVDLISSHSTRIAKALKTADEKEVRDSIAEARAALEGAQEPTAETRAFLTDLSRYSQRLDAFERVFDAETRKDEKGWAGWLRAALADATGGADLATLANEEVFETFKRHARYRWVTGADPIPAPESERVEEEDARTGKTGVIDTTGEVTGDSPASSTRPPNNEADPATKIGF